MVPRTWAPGAGPTHCREGLFGVEPFARDPGWGQERPGWACAGAGGSLGVLAFSSTSPILWSPTRLATPRADAGPKPQRLKVRGQAGLCTCLCLIQCSENSQLCLEAPSSPGNPSRQLCGQAWACPQLLQAHWVGCQAPGGALLAPGPVILACPTGLCSGPYWVLLTTLPTLEPSLHPGLGASKIQGWALPPGPMTIAPYPHLYLLEENSPVRQKFQGPQEHPIKS